MVNPFSVSDCSFGLNEDNAAEAISEVRAIVHNLRRLPGKARREGDNSPEVWVLFGREVHRLEVLAQKLGGPP